MIIQSNAGARLRALRLAAMVLPIVVMATGSGSASALAYESGALKTPAVGTGQYKAPAAVGGISLYSPSSPVKADPCLPLLDTIRQSPDTVPYRTRRPAGQTAVPAVAIGYVLGLRHAPGPKEILKDDISRGSSDNDPSAAMAHSHALTIAAYRHCRNELELSLMRRK